MPGLGWLRAIRDRRVRRRLLRDGPAPEDIVDEVHHHWIVYSMSILELLLAALTVYVIVTVNDANGLLDLLVVALVAHAAWRALVQFMDVFVVTNMRVFRVTGVLTAKHATTPLARILDITVEQPFLGLVLRYGHFTFESAAQEQGLRDIHFVSRPLARDKRIQELVQSSGLRGPRFKS